MPAQIPADRFRKSFIDELTEKLNSESGGNFTTNISEHDSMFTIMLTSTRGHGSIGLHVGIDERNQNRNFSERLIQLYTKDSSGDRFYSISPVLASRASLDERGNLDASTAIHEYWNPVSVLAKAASYSFENFTLSRNADASWESEFWKIVTKGVPAGKSGTGQYHIPAGFGLIGPQTGASEREFITNQMGIALRVAYPGNKTKTTPLNINELESFSDLLYGLGNSAATNNVPDPVGWEGPEGSKLTFWQRFHMGGYVKRHGEDEGSYFLSSEALGGYIKDGVSRVFSTSMRKGEPSQKGITLGGALSGRFQATPLDVRGNPLVPQAVRNVYKQMQYTELSALLPGERTVTNAIVGMGLIMFGYPAGGGGVAYSEEFRKAGIDGFGFQKTHRSELGTNVAALLQSNADDDKDSARFIINPDIFGAEIVGEDRANVANFNGKNIDIGTSSASFFAHKVELVIPAYSMPNGEGAISTAKSSTQISDSAIEGMRKRIIEASVAQMKKRKDETDDEYLERKLSATNLFEQNFSIVRSDISTEMRLNVSGMQATDAKMIQGQKSMLTYVNEVFRPRGVDGKYRDNVEGIGTITSEVKNAPAMFVSSFAALTRDQQMGILSEYATMLDDKNFGKVSPRTDNEYIAKQLRWIVQDPDRAGVITGDGKLDLGKIAPVFDETSVSTLGMRESVSWEILNNLFLHKFFNVDAKSDLNKSNLAKYNIGWMRAGDDTKKDGAPVGLFHPSQYNLWRAQSIKYLTDSGVPDPEGVFASIYTAKETKTGYFQVEMTGAAFAMPVVNVAGAEFPGMSKAINYDIMASISASRPDVAKKLGLFIGVDADPTKAEPMDPETASWANAAVYYDAQKNFGRTGQREDVHRQVRGEDGKMVDVNLMQEFTETDAQNLEKSGVWTRNTTAGPDDDTRGIEDILKQKDVSAADWARVKTLLQKAKVSFDPSKIIRLNRGSNKTAFLPSMDSIMGIANFSNFDDTDITNISAMYAHALRDALDPAGQSNSGSGAMALHSFLGNIFESKSEPVKRIYGSHAPGSINDRYRHEAWLGEREIYIPDTELMRIARAKSKDAGFGDNEDVVNAAYDHMRSGNAFALFTRYPTETRLHDTVSASIVTDKQMFKRLGVAKALEIQKLYQGSKRGQFSVGVSLQMGSILSIGDFDADLANILATFSMRGTKRVTEVDKKTGKETTRYDFNITEAIDETERRSLDLINRSKSPSDMRSMDVLGKLIDDPRKVAAFSAMQKQLEDVYKAGIVMSDGKVVGFSQENAVRALGSQLEAGSRMGWTRYLSLAESAVREQGSKLNMGVTYNLARNLEVSSNIAGMKDADISTLVSGKAGIYQGPLDRLEYETTPFSRALQSAIFDSEGRLSFVGGSGKRSSAGRMFISEKEYKNEQANGTSSILREFQLSANVLAAHATAPTRLGSTVGNQLLMSFATNPNAEEGASGWTPTQLLSQLNAATKKVIDRKGSSKEYSQAQFDVLVKMIGETKDPSQIANMPVMISAIGKAVHYMQEKGYPANPGNITEAEYSILTSDLVGKAKPWGDQYDITRLAGIPSLANLTEMAKDIKAQEEGGTELTALSSYVLWLSERFGTVISDANKNAKSAKLMSDIFNQAGKTKENPIEFRASKLDVLGRYGDSNLESMMFMQIGSHIQRHNFAEDSANWNRRGAKGLRGVAEKLLSEIHPPQHIDAIIAGNEAEAGLAKIFERSNRINAGNPGAQIYHTGTSSAGFAGDFERGGLNYRITAHPDFVKWTPGEAGDDIGYFDILELKTGGQAFHAASAENKAQMLATTAAALQLGERLAAGDTEAEEEFEAFAKGAGITNPIAKKKMIAALKAGRVRDYRITPNTKMMKTTTSSSGKPEVDPLLGLNILRSFASEDAVLPDGVDYLKQQEGGYLPNIIEKDFTIDTTAKSGEYSKANVITKTIDNMETAWAAVTGIDFNDTMTTLVSDVVRNENIVENLLNRRDQISEEILPAARNLVATVSGFKDPIIDRYKNKRRKPIIEDPAAQQPPQAVAQAQATAAPVIEEWQRQGYASQSHMDEHIASKKRIEELKARIAAIQAKKAAAASQPAKPMASGGDVPLEKGKQILVGENGPELLTINENSIHITPNGQVGAMAGVPGFKDGGDVSIPGKLTRREKLKQAASQAYAARKKKPLGKNPTVGKGPRKRTEKKGETIAPPSGTGVSVANDSERDGTLSEEEVAKLLESAGFMPEGTQSIPDSDSTIANNDDDNVNLADLLSGGSGGGNSDKPPSGTVTDPLPDDEDLARMKEELRREEEVEFLIDPARSRAQAASPQPQAQPAVPPIQADPPDPASPSASSPGPTVQKPNYSRNTADKKAKGMTREQQIQYIRDFNTSVSAEKGEIVSSYEAARNILGGRISFEHSRGYTVVIDAETNPNFNVSDRYNQIVSEGGLNYLTTTMPNISAIARKAASINSRAPVVHSILSGFDNNRPLLDLDLQPPDMSSEEYARFQEAKGIAARISLGAGTGTQDNLQQAISGLDTIFPDSARKAEVSAAVSGQIKSRVAEAEARLIAHPNDGATSLFEDLHQAASAAGISIPLYLSSPEHSTEASAILGSPKNLAASSFVETAITQAHQKSATNATGFSASPEAIAVARSVSDLKKTEQGAFSPLSVGLANLGGDVTKRLAGELDGLVKKVADASEALQDFSTTANKSSDSMAKERKLLAVQSAARAATDAKINEISAMAAVGNLMSEEPELFDDHGNLKAKTPAGVSPSAAVKAAKARLAQFSATQASEKAQLALGEAEAMPDKGSLFGSISREMLGGFGLMYLRSLANVAFGGLGAGSQESQNYRSIQQAMIGRFTGQGGVAKNSSMYYQNMAALRGSSTEPMQAAWDEVQYGPFGGIVNTALAGLGGAALGTEAVKWISSGVDGFAKTKAATRLPGALAGVAIGISTIASVATKMSDSEQTGWKLGQNPLMIDAYVPYILDKNVRNAYFRSNMAESLYNLGISSDEWSALKSNVDPESLLDFRRILFGPNEQYTIFRNEGEAVAGLSGMISEKNKYLSPQASMAAASYMTKFKVDPNSADAFSIINRIASGVLPMEASEIYSSMGISQYQQVEKRILPENYNNPTNPLNEWNINQAKEGAALAGRNKQAFSAYVYATNQTGNLDEINNILGTMVNTPGEDLWTRDITNWYNYSGLGYTRFSSPPDKSSQRYRQDKAATSFLESDADIASSAAELLQKGVIPNAAIAMGTDAQTWQNYFAGLVNAPFIDISNADAVTKEVTSLATKLASNGFDEPQRQAYLRSIGIDPTTKTYSSTSSRDISMMNTQIDSASRYGTLLQMNFGYSSARAEQETRYNFDDMASGRTSMFQQSLIIGAAGFDWNAVGMAQSLNVTLPSNMYPQYMTGYLGTGDTDIAGNPTGLKQFSTSMNIGNPNFTGGISGNVVAAYLWGNQAKTPLGNVLTGGYGKFGVSGRYTPGGSVGAESYMADSAYFAQVAGLGIASGRLQMEKAFTTGVGLNSPAYTGIINPQTGQPFGFNTGKFGFSTSAGSFTSQGGGIWGLEDAQRNLGYVQQQWQFGFQQRQLDTQNRQWSEQYGLQVTQARTQRQWAREDWGYQDLTRNLQFGWKQEDFQEQARFMTGRERRLAERQMRRETTMFGLETEQLGKQRSREEQSWKWEETRFEQMRRFHEEDKRLSQEQLDKTKEFFKVQKDLTEEGIKLQRAMWIKNLEYQQAEIGMQKQQLDLQYEYRKKMEEQWGLESERNTYRIKWQAEAATAVTTTSQAIVTLFNEMAKIFGIVKNAPNTPFVPPTPPSGMPGGPPPASPMVADSSSYNPWESTVVSRGSSPSGVKYLSATIYIGDEKIDNHIVRVVEKEIVQ